MRLDDRDTEKVKKKKEEKLNGENCQKSGSLEKKTKYDVDNENKVNKKRESKWRCWKMYVFSL